MSTALLRLLLTLVMQASVVRADESEDSLVGVWRYVGEVDTKADGSPAPPEVLSK